MLQRADGGHRLETQFVEIKAVADIIVGGDSLRVVIDHDGAVAAAAYGTQRADAAPVELHAAADAIGTGPQHDDGFLFRAEAHIVGVGAVAQVEVIGLSRAGRERIDALDIRAQAVFLPLPTHIRFLAAEYARNLDVGEALELGFRQQIGSHGVQADAGLQGAVGHLDPVEGIQEDLVDAGQRRDAFHGITGLEGGGDGEHARVGRMGEGVIQVRDLIGLVADKAHGALPDHAHSLLDGLLETLADGHHFADALHAGADLAGHTLDLGQIPARQLADHIIDLRALGRIADFRQGVTQADLGRHEGQRIAGRLGGKGRGTAQARVDLDDAVVQAPVRRKGELDVALADDIEMPHDLDGILVQEVQLFLCQALRGRDDDALARMDAQRVEVLHVADDQAAVLRVADDLELDLFPALERLLHQHLRCEGEGLGGRGDELRLIVAEAGTQSTEGEGRTDDDGIADIRRRLFRLFEGFGGVRLDGLDLDLVQAPDEEVAVLGVDDGRDRSAQDFHAVRGEESALVQLHAAVQGGLAAEGKQDPVGLLLFDDLGDEFRGDGEEVNLVGNAFRRLHRRDIGIDQDGTDAFLAQGLESLRATVVEFAGLADLEGATAQYQDFAQLLFHTLTFKPTLKIRISPEIPRPGST